MLIKRIIIVLLIIFLYFIQFSLFSATNTFLSTVSLLAIVTIWLGYIGSKWSLFIAVVSGILMDIQLNLIGVNLLSFLLLVSFIYFFKKKFITSDRFVYFISVAIISLCYLVAIQALWSWIFIGVFGSWTLVNGSEMKILFHFSNIWQFIFVNFLFLISLYVLFKKKFSLSLWYEKTA